MFNTIKKYFLEKKNEHAQEAPYQNIKKGIDTILVMKRGYDVNTLDSAAWAIKKMNGFNSFNNEAKKILDEDTNFDVRAKSGEHVFNYVLKKEKSQKNLWLSAYFLENMKDFSIFDQEEKNKLLLKYIDFPKIVLQLLKNGACASYLDLEGTGIIGLLEGVVAHAKSSAELYNVEQIKNVLSYSPPIAHSTGRKVIKQQVNNTNFDDNYLKKIMSDTLLNKFNNKSGNSYKEAKNVIESYINSQLLKDQISFSIEKSNTKKNIL